MNDKYQTLRKRPLQTKDETRSADSLKAVRAFRWRRMGLFVGLVVALGPVDSIDAVAKEVTGRIEAQLNHVRQGKGLGYIRTRITSAAEEILTFSPPLAVFMAVKESLPLEEAKSSEIALKGLTLEPSVAACAVDGGVVLRNRDRESATFVVMNRESKVVFEVSILPGDTAVYECTAGADGPELRQLRVKEWPLALGSIYVGEVGTPGIVDADGRFSLPAPNGTYVLRIVGQTGVLHQVDVVVDDQPVSVGAIKLLPSIEN